MPMSKEPPGIEQEHERIQRTAFSTVAHDLRTPLACIIGSLEVIEQMKEKLSDEQRDTLISTALSQAHRLDGMISDMLGKAKPK